MLKNHKLAGAIADSGFHEFRRQLEYKAQWHGSNVVVIGRFYPSSQLCSNCKHRQPMPLKLRTFNCESCGLEIDRDFNASINIRDYPDTAASSAVAACGHGNGESSPEGGFPAVGNWRTRRAQAPWKSQGGSAARVAFNDRRHSACKRKEAGIEH